MHFDFIQSRIHGMENIDALVAECSKKFPIPEATIRNYLTTNIHYVLDDECLEGMSGFFRMAAETASCPPTAFHPKRWRPLAARILNLRKKGPAC